VTQPIPVQLFSRSSVVTVGSIEISNIGQQTGLDVWFQVRRSLKPGEPNSADLRIFNLSDDSRKAIEQSANGFVDKSGNITGRFVSAASVANLTAEDFASLTPLIPVKIDAGYEQAGMSTIFLGEMRSAGVVGDGPDMIVELNAGDGDQAMVLARSTAAFGPGCNAYTVALHLLSDANMGEGNIDSVATILKNAPLYSKGVVLKGSSWDHLLDLCRSCGLEVSVQHGVAQFTSLGQPLPGHAYKLSSDTGLIGSPSVDTKGVLSCQTLMLPGLAPGSPIEVDAKYVKGRFRIISIETTGETGGRDWYHRIEAKSIGRAP
jgi:hypothetical protein